MGLTTILMQTCHMLMRRSPISCLSPQFVAQTKVLQSGNHQHVKNQMAMNLCERENESLYSATSIGHWMIHHNWSIILQNIVLNVFKVTILLFSTNRTLLRGAFNEGQSSPRITYKCTMCEGLFKLQMNIWND